MFIDDSLNKNAFDVKRAKRDINLSHALKIQQIELTPVHEKKNNNKKMDDHELQELNELIEFDIQLTTNQTEETKNTESSPVKLKASDLKALKATNKKSSQKAIDLGKVNCIDNSPRVGESSKKTLKSPTPGGALIEKTPVNIHPKGARTVSETFHVKKGPGKFNGGESLENKLALG